MRQALKLDNPIQSYDWGSRRAIGSLLGKPVPTVERQAELWMGDHPKASSSALWEGRWHPLGDLVRRFPAEILGVELAARGDVSLPYLFKILAAEAPLSIQAHPDRARAKAGYLREEQLGIPIRSGRRSYRDPNPKPEILYALEPFWVLCGFRPAAEVRGFLDRLTIGGESTFGALELRSEKRGIEGFFTSYMQLEEQILEPILATALARAEPLADRDDVFRWILELARWHPGDRGILAPIFLDLYRLEPGEAIYTEPGVLHAYLGGLGIELMVNSDNVLRGGLTHKRVDVPELLSILRFESGKIRPLAADIYDGETRFICPELTLSVLEPAEGRPWWSSHRRSVEILLCTEGEGAICPEVGGESQTIRRGDSFLVPAAVGRYRVEGEGKLFLASAPSPS